MSEKQEFKGVWWLPEQPDHKVPGQLILTPYNDAYIELQGDLRQDKLWSTHFSPSILLGFSIGKNITLEKCLLTHRTINLSGSSTLRFFAHKVYVGVHFKNIEEIRFKNILVRYANLDDWADYRSFQVEHDPSLSRIAIQYERPEPSVIKTNDYEMVIQANWSMKTSGTEINLTEKTGIFITSREFERPIDDLAAVIRHLQDFLSLAVGIPTFPIEIVGQTGVSKRKTDSGKEEYNNVQIFYSVIGWNSDPKKANFEMLFTLPDIREQLPILLSNWMEKAVALSPVFDLYFSTLYNPHLYVDSIFLNLTQAIETYHRRRFGGKYQPDSEYESNLYKRLIEAIPSDIDQGFKQSLISGKLKYANEYSLRKRLQELVNYLAAKGSPLSFIANKELSKIFIEKTCDTRNYLTHYDRKLQEKAVNDSELYVFTMRLRGLLEIFLLDELGFDFKSIWEIVLKNRGMRYRLGIDKY